MERGQPLEQHLRGQVVPGLLVRYHVVLVVGCLLENLPQLELVVDVAHY